LARTEPRKPRRRKRALREGAFTEDAIFDGFSELRNYQIGEIDGIIGGKAGEVLG
jgi:hypothetical protein